MPLLIRQCALVTCCQVFKTYAETQRYCSNRCKGKARVGESSPRHQLAVKRKALMLKEFGPELSERDLKIFNKGLSLGYQRGRWHRITEGAA